MMTRKEAEEILLDSNPDALFFDGLDDAIGGIVERPNFGPVVYYHEEKIIEILAEQMEPEPDDLFGRDISDVKMEMALEYYDYNIKNTWVGEGTPMISIKYYK